MSVIQITDLNDPQLDIYARLSEGQLLHYYEPDLGIFIAESPKVIQTAFEQGYEPISFLVEDRHIKTQAKDIILQYQDIPVYTASVIYLLYSPDIHLPAECFVPCGVLN